MKLQPDKSTGLMVNAYGDAWIEVNGQKFFHSLVVSSLPDARPVEWQISRFEDLKSTNFNILTSSGAELVLFGSGKRLRFPSPVWIQSLIEMGVGIETMDTPAACRTYNILASEGRKVVAVLLIES